MNRALISCIGLLSALAIVQPAVADEPPSKPKRQRAAAPERAAPERAAPQRAAPQRAAPTQASNWSGGQVGGSNGVSSVNNNFVEPGAYICPPGSSFGSTCFETPFQFSGHKAVYTIGPFVGYRWMIGKGPYPGSTVFGIEGDWSWKNAETSLNQSSSTLIAVTGSNFLRTDQFSGSVKQKSDSSIRARLGILVTPWSLLYVTGGVAFEEISGSFAYTGSLCPPSSSSSCAFSPVGTATTVVSWSDTRVGSTVGAGWETEIAPGWKARAEYRYTDFGTYTKNFPLTTSCSGCASPSSNVSIDLKESFHTFRIGLAFDLSNFGKAPY
jgi:outer membrane immunogenic protein